MMNSPSGKPKTPPAKGLRRKNHCIFKRDASTQMPDVKRDAMSVFGDQSALITNADLDPMCWCRPRNSFLEFRSLKS